MADSDRVQTSGHGTAQTEDHSSRPDPVTGEVRAGPGDAGLEDRPEINAGTAGTRQMANSRLGLVLGIMALLAVLVFVLRALF